MDDILSKATIIVKEKIDPTSPIENQQPLNDEMVLSFFQLRGADISKDEVKQLKDVEDYVNSVSKSEDRLDKLQVLRDLRFRLGEPAIGQKLHEQVYQYVKLKQAAQKYAAEAEAMEA